MKKIAVLMTCHNRREKTIESLRALYSCSLPKEVSLHCILVDDGSNDQTSETVHEHFPEVEILHGNGNLFWNGGMHMAFAQALTSGFDFYLWLNDDTLLQPDVIERLLATHHRLLTEIQADSIVVGSTMDPISQETTYGGMLATDRLRPFRFQLVSPGTEPKECHTINGNCVLIPASVANRVGNLDSRFAHAMGDIDYGLRARAAGIKSFVIPGHIGFCSKNPSAGTFSDKSLPLSVRWKKIMPPKGLPPASWWVLTRRHGGILAPLYWIWPYIRVIF